MKLAMMSTAAILTASAALAGGYTPPVTEPAPAPIMAAPVAAPVADWNGFYAGLQYGQGSADLSGNGVDASEDFDAYGVHGGYLYDTGRYVFGGELDYNKVDFDETDGDADLGAGSGDAAFGGADIGAAA